jgi:hypothetical protein
MLKASEPQNNMLNGSRGGDAVALYRRQHVCAEDVSESAAKLRTEAGSCQSMVFRIIGLVV